MQEIDDLHRKAMALADLADQAKRSGNIDEYEKLNREALQYESSAAWQVVGDISFEPSRSVLLRSAATLAIECGELRDAERLIGAALGGEPPSEIADELRDLLEDVYFYRHLEVKGITLNPGEVQMVLEGKAVGFGIARSDAFIQRVRDLETLLCRTAERRLGLEFREAGRPKKSIADNLELYLSVPRAASFAVTLRLGQSPQYVLPGMDLTTETMRDLLDGISMVVDGDLDKLERSIPDESYRINFISLVERLAPDGEDIRTVGFTAATDQQERVVALTAPKKELRERIQHLRHMKPPEKTTELIEIRGVLLEANAKKRKEGVIEVVDSQSNSHKIFVPRGMMSDIVKPMFEEEVVVVGVRRGNRIDLQSIDPAELVS